MKLRYLQKRWDSKVLARLFTQDDLINRCLTNESSLIILSVCSWFGAMIKDSLISNVDQRILQFLAKFSDKELHEREIARRIGIAAGSANRALNDLFKTGALKRRREGKMLFYSVNTANPAIIEFKKLVSIMLLEPLVEELKDLSSKVILYGSCAQGTDTSKSDVDLLIVTNKVDNVRQALEDYHFPQGFEGIRIQAVIKTPPELLEAGDSQRVFLDEVETGITLWEAGK